MKVTFAVLCLAAAAAAQPPDTFEVASIKLGDPLTNGTSFNFQNGAGIKIDGATLKSLIQFAYDLNDYQLVGASGWMTSDRYAILAKGVVTEGPAGYRDMNDQQRKFAGALIRTRLKKLLAERFQLAIHNETRELPIYALVLAKGGVKMQPNTSPDGSPQSMMTGRATFKATRASVDSIAKALGSITSRPVYDETGLKGYWDFKMEWTPEAAAAAPDAIERPVEAAGPTLFTALQEQMGLKLEARKGPVEIVVIDRAERPSEN
jgi:bla regulator protein blaR1